MKRRGFLGLTAAAFATGCLGGSGPSDEEWDNIRGYSREMSDHLEDVREDLVSWRDDSDSVSADTFRDHAQGVRDIRDEYPLPDPEDVEEWRFDVSREDEDDDESWRVQGEDLDEALLEMARADDSAERACDGIADADGDPDELSGGDEDAVDDAIDDIPDAVDGIRELVFGT
ncbi:MAG: hypothetical protein ACOCT0_02500 [Halobacteriota archaeon]